MELPNFRRVMRGYDPEEVDKAWAELQRNLAEANASNRELRLQMNSLREQNTEWGNRLKSYEKMEQDLRDALLSAQRVAAQVRQEADQAAQQVLEQAKVEAESLVTEAQLDAERKAAELEELITRKTGLLHELEERVSELTSQKELLEARMEKVQGQLDILRNLLDG